MRYSFAQWSRVPFSGPQGGSPRRGLNAQELTISLVNRYAHTWPIAIELVLSGRVDVTPLITHHFRLEQTEEALTLRSHVQDSVKAIHPPPAMKPKTKEAGTTPPRRALYFETQRKFAATATTVVNASHGLNERRNMSIEDPQRLAASKGLARVIQTMLGIQRDREALERKDMDAVMREPKSFTQDENGLEKEA